MPEDKSKRPSRAETPSREPETKPAIENESKLKNLDPVDIDAVSQVQVVMQHLQYDQEIFWERFGFMLIAQTAILGFFFNLLMETLKNSELRESLTMTAILVGLAITGLFVAQVFGRLSRITGWWIDRWLKIISEELEPRAFGKTQLFRDKLQLSGKAVAPHGSARRQAVHILNLFRVIWIAMLFIVIARYAFGDRKASEFRDVFQPFVDLYSAIFGT